MKNNRFLLFSHPRLLMILAFLIMGTTALGFQTRQEPSKFDHLVIWDPSNVSVATTPVDSLSTDDPLRIGWNSFKAAHGPGWKIYLDSRSGAPLLVEGQGIPWIPGTGNNLTSPTVVTLDYLEKTLREFMAKNVAIVLADVSELVLNRDASLQLTPEVWQIVFNRVVNGNPVAGENYFFFIGHGNLVSFGATRWSKITTSPTPSLPSNVALQNLLKYMGLKEDEEIEYLNSGELLFLPVQSVGGAHDWYTGIIGEGYSSALAWKFIIRVAGELGTWVGMVDSHSGAILALYDDNKYAQVKGSVYPESDDQICPSGCAQPNYPMSYADLNVGGTPQTASDMGMFDCTPAGSTATTTLNGPYIYVHDNCGSISESVTCDDDLDMRTSDGTDCTVPSGSSAGNTHSSRSSFYHLNRAAEHARFWLPDNSWIKQKLTDNVNINATCNAYWNGSVNFYKSGGGCRNTGEIAGVVLHEWGHGMDQNDGGGYDNPSEAYADTTEFMYDHTSCIGRGFWVSQQCGGYGNPCEDCTGIRDMDWDKRVDHQPSTAANWSDNCGGGGGPCGNEEHCEGYISGESVWDLAARDLPANGYDQPTSWQITDRLWYKSRSGSSGNAYNCTPPNSDGCNSTSWFNKFRNVDDDDGDLNNGTPHAAAIFAAFNRHNIACGSANDASNKNYTTCPSIGGTTLSGSAGSNSASLSWTPVENASTYYVLRNDTSCDWSYTVIATVAAPNTTYTDSGLANDFTEYYRVQAVGSNSSCFGPVSNCVDVTPQPFAGSIKFDRSQYNCNDTITITVRDANVGASTVNVTIWSTTEPDPETVICTETPPGSSKFIGTINTTPSAPASDGLLSLTNGDTITGQYIDADDGEGGHDLVRQTTAVADCIGPNISDVMHKDITDTKATITWLTDEASDSVVKYGQNKPPTNEKSSSTLVTNHSIQLTNLQSCTIYYYEVNSSDSSHNKAVDDNNGQYYHFETMRYDPQSGLESCHAGKVYLDRSDYSCSDTLSIRVVDIDLNADKTIAETTTVTVTSTSETTPETVLLTETGVDTSTFTGTIMTDSGTPAADGKLQTKHGELLTVTYHDADDGTGATAVSYTTATADCSGPAFSNIKVTDYPPFKVTISWNTSEASTSRLDYGTTTALGRYKENTTLKTSHSFDIDDLDLCELNYFKISGTDIRGNARVDDRNGQLYTFETGRVPTAVMVEGFEKDTSGWTLNGEWQIGIPQGLGGSGEGYKDPTSAYMGAKVLGTDLTGLGSYPGDYEPNISPAWEAVSYEMDTRGLANSRLIIRRWLNVHYGMVDQAGIWGYKGGWNQIWQNPNTVNDGSWQVQTYDISTLTENNGRFKIKFTIASNFEIQESGWNIDNIIIKDGTAPDGEPCGGCTHKPSFAGLKSATDLDPCADTGVSLSWDAAVAWGSGSSGKYVIYRDTIPNFTPSSSNMIASGLTTTSYTDTGAPNDVTLYYLVRAENNETCSTGPANGGVVDDNTVYISVKDATSQPIPGDIGSTLRLQKINAVHLRLTWDAAANATTYNIYRADNPQMTGAVKIGSTSNLFYDDTGELTKMDKRYYKVKAANSCGQEGP
ncbi:MAG: hypothetical protein AB1756_02460 [Acidobacteriota bacterium]